jgi:surface antigen
VSAGAKAAGVGIGAVMALPLVLMLMVAAVFSGGSARHACIYGDGAGPDASLPETAVSSDAGGGVVPGGGAVAVVGMDETAARAWFGGLQGPGNVCGPYAYGQCTWWACMRSHRLGNPTGSFWGNGNQWVTSAMGAGWTLTTSPVPGAVFSHAAGTNGASGLYGHTGVVESVDLSAGTVTTSEKGAGYAVWSKTYRLGTAGMTFANPPGQGTSGDKDAQAAPEPAQSDDKNASAPPDPARPQASMRTLADGTVEVTGVDPATRNRQCSNENSGVRYIWDTSWATGTNTGTDAGDAGGVVDHAEGWHASPDTAKRIARVRNRESGFGDEDYSCLVNLWTRESSWRWEATNPSSFAYGIPQSLPAGKMAVAGVDWRDNADTQIIWGLSYIKSRYGTPCEAWAHSERVNWY